MTQPPQPTSPPDPAVVAQRLLERQNPVTCGYVNGNSASPVTCSVGSTCAQNNQNHYCCVDPNNCILPSACLDSTAVGNACDASCLANPDIIKCTYASIGLTYSYCYTRYWSVGSVLVGYGCALEPTTQTVYSTYFSSSSPAAKSTSSSSSPAAKSTSSSNLGSSSSGASNPSPSSGVNGGEIAGIAVGGVVACVLLVLLAVLIYKKYINPPTPPPDPSGRHNDLPLSEITFVPGPGTDSVGPDDSASHIFPKPFTPPLSPVHESTVSSSMPGAQTSFVSARWKG